jgi:hypothetical protein
MPALPSNNTAQYFIEYTNGLDEHVLGVRYDDSTATLTDAIRAVELFFLELEPLLWSGFQYIQARQQAKGANFTLPAPIPSVAPTPGGSTITEFNAPLSHTFVGRTNGGRRNVAPIYAIGLDPPAAWVWRGGDQPVLSNTVTYLNGGGVPLLPAGTFIGIDGQPVIWYDRITVTYNDYWIRQNRR